MSCKAEAFCLDRDEMSGNENACSYERKEKKNNLVIPLNGYIRLSFEFRAHARLPKPGVVLFSPS